MVTALVSALLGRPVRQRLAMTGEITLSGHVLPVGGIKEKVLAARRAGVRDLVLPAENEKNVLEDVQPELLEESRFHYVRTIEEVLPLALEGLEVGPEEALAAEGEGDAKP
jgi:ATP-dependent Lon protease